MTLSAERGLVLKDGSIVVRKFLRGKLLSCSHSAHEDVDGKKVSANGSVYWLEL